MSGNDITIRAPGARRTRQTDWSKFDAKTDEDIAADVAGDPDAAPLLGAEWFESARLVEPDTKEKISIRLDRDVLEFFRQQTKYQSRINAVLRAFVEHEKKRA
ncbi:MAG: hypothetical protein JWO51_2179 [Rhodospirillales bacterium]|nr:hypothetical protein [Rhodospirillales bacterium]